MSLNSIHHLEEALNLAEWSHRQVAATTAFVLGLILATLHEKGGIRWHSLVHAFVSGYLSLGCVYLSYHHPASNLCQGPLTAFHRITPAITMGYGMFDIFEAVTKSLSIDFLLHGVATFAVAAYFCEVHLPEILLPFLLMEISTVHLVFMKATDLSERVVAANMALFVGTFFLFRLIVCPYIWCGTVRQAFGVGAEGGDQACLPWHVKYGVLVFGMIFHVLNVFWGYKILLKLRRKLSGKEGVKQGNSLKEFGKESVKQGNSWKES